MRKLYLGISYILFAGIISNMLVTEVQAEDITVQSLDLNNQEVAYLKRQNRFRYCADPKWHPVEWIDEANQHRGYVRDYLTLIESRLDIEFELVLSRSWSEVLAKAKSRECDFISAAMFTQDRSLYLDFTQPYLSYAIAVVSHKYQSSTQGLAHYQGKTFAIVKGYSYEEKLRNNYPGINIVYVNDAREGLKLASAMKIDGYFDSQMIIAYNMHKQGLMDLKISDRLKEHMTLSLAVRNDEPLLLSILDKAVNSVSEKEKRQIQDKWESSYSTTEAKKQHDERKFWSGVIVILTGLFFVVVYLLMGIIHKQKNRLSQLKNNIEDIKGLDTYLNTLDRFTCIDRLEQLWQDNHQKKLPAMLVCIDGFSKVRQHLGLREGEALLKAIVFFIRERLPKGVELGRWADDQFMLLGAKQGFDELILLAETLRYETARHQFIDGLSLTLTLVLPDDKITGSLLEILSDMQTRLSDDGSNQVNILRAKPDKASLSIEKIEITALDS